MTTSTFRRPLVTAAIAVPVTILLVIVGLVAVAPRAHADEGTIVRVVDGDTVDVAIANKTERVRLLNINAPEDNPSHDDVECLGPEATAALAELLPEGARVTLSFDQQRRDKYGRLLAGVTTAEGVFASDAIAARGLAMDAYYGDNEKHLDGVKDAVAQAQRDKVGYFDAAVGCTPEAAISKIEEDSRLLTVPREDAPSNAMAATIATATGIASATVAAQTAVTTLSWLPEDVASSWTSRITAVADLVARTTENTKALKVKAEAREAAAKAAAEKKAAAKKAAAKKAAEANKIAAAKKAREEQKAAKAQKAADAARQTQQATQDTRPSQGNSSATPSRTAPKPPASEPKPAAPGGKYTGCRAYGPTGTSIDAKGRRYTKINCTTKLPIG